MKSSVPFSAYERGTMLNNAYLRAKWYTWRINCQETDLEVGLVPNSGWEAGTRVRVAR
jgi:hypothetical protein